MTLIQLIYLANVIVAGWISISSLLFPKTAISSVFTNDFKYSESIRLVGALWGGIFILSVLGLFFPIKMALILVFQLIYKLSWLAFAALPAHLKKKPYPRPMSLFFFNLGSSSAFCHSLEEYILNLKHGYSSFYFEL